MPLSQSQLRDLRSREAPCLRDALPLDFAASPPVLLSALEAFHKDIATNSYANPHSRSPSSVRTELKIDQVRRRILNEIFGVSPAHLGDWDLIFTSGATAACRIVANCFPWTDAAEYRYARASHTSLVGIRGAALKAGASVRALLPAELASPTERPSLAAYPLQCNATGQRISIALCRDIKRSSPDTYVLLDTAAYLSTSPLNLSTIPQDEAPDFLVWSAYKTYGWPTGLGCLVVKRSSGHILQKNGYFGGGSIDSMSVHPPFATIPASKHDSSDLLYRRFEDGTLPFLDIVALDSSMTVFNGHFGSLASIGPYVSQLVQSALRQMKGLKHGNEFPVCRVYDLLASPYADPHGSAIAFTLLDPHGRPAGHVELDKLAAVNDIHLRTGGLCNIGALAEQLGLTDAELAAKGRVCWDEVEFIEGTDKPTGLARISFGALSLDSDVERWIAFLRKFFVVPAKVEAAAHGVKCGQELPLELMQLCIYPIKSCAGMHLAPGQHWPVTAQGLLFDREWMIVDSANRRALTQKRHPKMACIRASVDLSAASLSIFVPHHGSFLLDTGQAPTLPTSGKVCADTVQSHRHSLNELDEALSSWLGVACTLHRISPLSASSRHSHFAGSSRTPIGLSNESPFLLINAASVSRVDKWCMSEGEESKIGTDAFRANFVIKSVSGSDAAAAFIEDAWQSLRIGSQTFQVLAQCRRCQMVNIDQETGEQQRQPLSVLSQRRRDPKGRVLFGLHLMHAPALSSVPYTLARSFVFCDGHSLVKPVHSVAP